MFSVMSIIMSDKNQLVFIANFPTDESLRDGMMQRVAAIDSLTNDQPRVYLDISFKRNFKSVRTVNGNCIVEHLNYFIHHLMIRRYLNNARVIYIHSLYNLVKVLFLNNMSKTVLDIHGVVPEENEFVNNRVMAKFYNVVEKHVIKNCHQLIHVTRSMLEHYEKKYTINLKDRSIILPIFERNQVSIKNEKWASSQLEFVYAGGMQAWQNIELMVGNAQLLENDSCVKFNFFFPSQLVPVFDDKYKGFSAKENVFIGSLPKNEMLEFLSKCHLGFILRDPITVNMVACPTKLIEYFECGIVPIVKSPDIGDFNRMGYKYITINDINQKWKLDDLQKMAEHNYNVLAEFHTLALKSQKKIESIFSF